MTRKPHILPHALIPLILSLSVLSGCIQQNGLTTADKDLRIKKEQQIEDTIRCCFSSSFTPSSHMKCSEGSENVNQAISHLTRKAEFGDVRSQLVLGTMYQYGLCVKEDEIDALKWLHLASDNGVSGAQTQLGKMYLYGHGVEQDSKKALPWFIKAAEQGDADAMVTLAKCYLRGWGTSIDYEAARRWYEKAAELEEPLAYTGLAYIFDNGYGVKKDIEEAIHWYEKAATAGENKAYHQLAHLYTDTHLQQGDTHTIMQWLRKAAMDDCNQAQYLLARMYQFGWGTPSDQELALTWYSKAALSGNKLSVTALREMYENGFLPVGDSNRNAIPSQPASTELSRQGNLISYADGTVIDTDQKLMWAASATTENMNWVEAMQHCYSSNLAGYSDWRMPTRLELAHLYNQHGIRSEANGKNQLIQLSKRIWTQKMPSEADLHAFSFTAGHSQTMRPGNSWNLHALQVRSIE